MSFSVKGFLDDHTLPATIPTAKEAFAKAAEWHDTGRFNSVTITDDSKRYSIVAFALAMAHVEIAKTGDDAADATVVSAAGYGLTSAGLSRIDGALGRTMSRRLRGPIDP